jgi:hypothetical protein
MDTVQNDSPPANPDIFLNDHVDIVMRQFFILPQVPHESARRYYIVIAPQNDNVLASDHVITQDNFAMGCPQVPARLNPDVVAQVQGPIAVAPGPGNVPASSTSREPTPVEKEPDLLAALANVPPTIAQPIQNNAVH